jgi:hypothetical protein
VLHALTWTCPAVQDVRGVCSPRIQKMLTTDRDFQSILEVLTERCSKEDLDLRAVLARGIWTGRINAVVHGEDRVRPS